MCLASKTESVTTCKTSSLADTWGIGVENCSHPCSQNGGRTTKFSVSPPPPLDLKCHVRRDLVNCVRAFMFHRCHCRRHRLVSGVCASVKNQRVGRGWAGAECAWRRDDKQPERTTVQASSPKRLWFFPPRRRCAYATTMMTTGKSKVGKRSNSPLAGIALLPPRFYTVSSPSPTPCFHRSPIPWA